MCVGGCGGGCGGGGVCVYIMPLNCFVSDCDRFNIYLQASLSTENNRTCRPDWWPDWCPDWCPD